MSLLHSALILYTEESTYYNQMREGNEKRLQRKYLQGLIRVINYLQTKYNPTPVASGVKVFQR